MNYLAVRSVSMRSLNRQRANLVFSSLLQQMKELEDAEGDEELNFPTPEMISRQERIFESDSVLRWLGDQTLGYAQIGVPFGRILDFCGKADENTGSYTALPASATTSLLEIFEGEDYVMLPGGIHSPILIALKESATTETQLQAWMHALWFAAKERDRGDNLTSLMAPLEDSLSDVKGFLQAYDVFERLKKAGWDVETGALETKSGMRIRISRVSE
jgi:hypothetical protein